MVESSGSSENPSSTRNETLSLVDGVLHNKWVFVSVCVGCAAAAIAAGSYAAWLHTKRDSESAMLDVQDLVQTCEERVAQIEAEIKRMSHNRD